MRLTVPPFSPRLVVIATVCAIALGGCGRNDPATLMSSAKKYLSKNDYNAAAIQVKNVLLQDPHNSEARYLLGVALLNSGSAVAGEIELRKALDAGLTSDDVYLQLAQALLDQGANDKLISELNQRVLSSPVAQAELRATIGYAMLNLGKVNEARESFDAALNGDPKNASARLGQARLAAAYKRDLDAALKLTEEVLIDYPRHDRATLLKGDILSTQGDRAGAEAAYREAIAAAPTNIPPRMNLIGLLVRSAEFEKASAEVEALAKVAPRDPRTAYAKSLVLVVQKKFPDAKESILQVLGVAPNHTPTLLLAGIIAYELRAYSEAEGHLRKAVDQAPNALLPKRLLAAARLRNGQITRALSDVQELLRRAPDDPAVLALAGEAYLANGDVVRASHYYERVNSLRPESTAARTRLGQIRLAAGDTERAVQDLEAASAANPAPSQADFSLITTFLRQKEFDKALEAVLMLEQKQPDNPMTQNLKGIVYLAKRDLKTARSSFERAVAIFPDYLPALINLAGLDLRDNNAEAAKKRFEAILKKDPNNEQALLANATLLRATGAAADEIVKQLQKAVSANPTAPAARLALVNHYLLARDTKAALSAAQNAQAALPDNPSILNAFGTTQIVAGESRQAISTFAKLAKLVPNSAEPLVKQASAQVAAGDADGAIQSLRKALTLKPDLALVQQHITSIYVRSGRVKEAIQEARDLQQKQPKSPLGFILEGDIYVQQRDWANAEKRLSHRVAEVRSAADSRSTDCTRGSLRKASEKPEARWTKTGLRTTRRMHSY